MKNFDALIVRCNPGQINADGGLVLVAEGGAGITGYLLGTQGQRSPVYAIRSVGMIFDLVVGSNHRGRGIGTSLVNYARNAFRTLGLGHVQVNYDPSNEEAVRFWRSQGFNTLLVEAYRPIEDSDDAEFNG